MLAQCTWAILNKSSSNARTRLVALEAAANHAFKGPPFFLELWSFKLTYFISEAEDAPSKGKITSAIRCVSQWRNLAELHCTTKNVRLIDEMTEKLDALMASVGASAKAKVPRKSTLSLIETFQHLMDL